MARYSIKDLEKLSGIKAHTLRIWEKRFDLLSPERTDTNIRYYSDDDLKKLLNVTLLCNSGMKISKVALMSQVELCEAVKNLENEDFESQKKVDYFVKAMIDLDEDEFNSKFKDFENEMGFEKTLTDVVYPFLEKVGVLWLSDEIQPVHEHFTTHLIRNKIVSAIEQLPPANDKRKAILFLPEDEYHELGLLFFYYLLKKEGVKVYYMGQSVPTEQVAAIAEEIKPNWVLTYSVIKRQDELREYVKSLKDFKAEEAFFFENKFQHGLNLDYPKGVCRITENKTLLDKVS
jgi:DNA-binding transcriptional MerR regulator